MCIAVVDSLVICCSNVQGDQPHDAPCKGDKKGWQGVRRTAKHSSSRCTHHPLQKADGASSIPIRQPMTSIGTNNPVERALPAMTAAPQK